MGERGHQDLRPGDITAIIDARESRPLELWIPSERGTLAAGDFSVKGLTHLIAVERKAENDMLACVGRERDRFEACIKRMQGYETRVLVIESSWSSIELGQWRSTLKPSQVKAALYSWMKYVSVVMVGDRQASASIISGILFSAARERWRELRAFQDNLKLAPQETS